MIRQTLQAVDTLKGLAVLGFEGAGNGSYVSFPCPKCHEKTVFKAYGEKKNVWFCPKCKAAENIVSLAMESKGTQWEEAKQILGKAITLAQKEIAKELTLNYELQYHKFFEEQGIPEELCKTIGTGCPRARPFWLRHLHGVQYLSMPLTSMTSPSTPRWIAPRS